MGYPWEDADIKRQQERPSDICERCDRPRAEHAHDLCYWRDHGGGAHFLERAAPTQPQASESANDAVSEQRYNAIIAEREAAIRELAEVSRRCGYAEEERDWYKDVAQELYDAIVVLQRGIVRIDLPPSGRKFVSDILADAERLGIK